eukprot:scaffold7246_cov136-Skeletonema_marinoi.AAC.6
MTEHEMALAERKDLLVLAQQKLDEMNRGSSFLAGTKSPSSKKGTAASNLLSTLLYMALMTYKVEDMKAMLKHIDFESYEQWDALLAVLHCPEFHVKERSLQNERVARTFERKNQYKTKASALNDQLATTSAKLDQVQRISNETCNEMSKTINTLQQELSKLNGKLHDAVSKFELERKTVQSLQVKVRSKDLVIDNLNQQLDTANKSAHMMQQEVSELNNKQHDSHAKIELEREAVQSLKDKVMEKNQVVDKLNQQLDTANESAHALQQELSELNTKLHDAHANIELERKTVQSLQDKLRSTDLVVDKLNQQLDTANERIHGAAKESCESKSRVETIESQFTSYKEEKETQVNKLQQDLVKAETENASLSEQLATLSDKLESKVALLCKSTAELLGESRRDSNAQIEARSTLSGISNRSQQTLEVLLQVKEQKQVDVDEILRTIRSTMSEELQVMHATLEHKLVPTKPSSDRDKEIDEQNDEPEHRATAFVQNILSEAFETTICT